MTKQKKTQKKFNHRENHKGLVVFTLSFNARSLNKGYNNTTDAQ